VPPVGLDLADVVAMRGRVAALRADQPPAAQRDLNDHPASLEPDRPDPHPIELKKPGKCRGDAHVVLPRKPLTFEQPAACPWGRRRVAHQRATSENFRRRGKRCSRTQTRLRVTYIDYRSPKKALGAVKHSILCICWHMLTTGELYTDLGGDYFRKRDPERLTKRLIAQLESLGHKVTLEELPHAA